MRGLAFFPGDHVTPDSGPADGVISKFVRGRFPIKLLQNGPGSKVPLQLNFIGESPVIVALIVC